MSGKSKLRREFADASYTSEFYKKMSGLSYLSATNVLPVLFERLKPKSIIDVGCGTGTWMAAAKRLGVPFVAGIEGPWLTKEDLFRPDIEIAIQDLEKPLAVDQRFDLCMCLEVAEHLSPERAGSLIADICRIADAAFFSAAIPQQTGRHHINCRWQTYWADLFAQQGRIAVDVIRQRFWGKRDVAWWYQQNALLYMAEDKAKALGYEPLERRLVNIVHPEMIVPPIDPSFWALLFKETPKAFARGVQRRWSRLLTGPRS
jgi:SAM-dependent methyltransferase